QHAFHRAELLGDLVGRAERKVVAELGAPLDGGEDEARRPRDIATADAEGKPRQGRTAADPGLPDRRRRRTHERVRSSMRWRASSTPGSDSNARSSAPSSCRTGSRSISSAGGASYPYISRAHAGKVPTATRARSRHRSRISASRLGGSSTKPMASFAAGVPCRKSTDSRYPRSEATVL